MPYALVYHKIPTKFDRVQRSWGQIALGYWIRLFQASGFYPQLAQRASESFGGKFLFEEIRASWKIEFFCTL